MLKKTYETLQREMGDLRDEEMYCVHVSKDLI
jgi:hypothetical protein